MKSKEEINKLAHEVAQLELQAQKFFQQGQDKSLQTILHRFEDILKELSPKEGLELNDIVENLLRKS